MEPVEGAHPVIQVIARWLGLKGWLALGWPKEYGGQGSPLKEVICKEELHYHRLPRAAIDAGVAGASVVATLLMNFGSEEQKREHLPRIAAGESIWAFGYSERGSGSDFASIQCCAEADGGDYLVRGQKIWSTFAHFADWCLLAVRTGSPDSKHRGISLLLMDMKTPGIEVHPLRNTAGIHVFNEISLDQVRVPQRNLVGEENQAWPYLRLALNIERLTLTTDYLGGSRRGLDELVAYARGRQLAGQSIVRHKLAQLAIEVEVARLLLYHLAWLQDRGTVATLDASVARLFSGELIQRMAGVGMEILGLYGQLREGSSAAPLKGYIRYMPRGYLSSLCCPLMGGTSEIQRNIIATRGLGLPA